MSTTELAKTTAPSPNGQDFRVTTFRVNMPKWLQILDADNEIISSCVEAIKTFTTKVKFLRDNKPEKIFKGHEFFTALETVDADAERSTITYELIPQPDLYYKVLSKMSGVTIASEAELVAYVRELSIAKAEYDKIKTALEQAETTGYGVVIPTWQTFGLEQPVLHRNGKNYGVKLRANASSLHIVKVDVKSEVNPIIGSQEQSQEMLKFLQTEYETNRQSVWNTPIFGKSLESIVREDISNKSVSMPSGAQQKMRTALGRIVNNGKGGVICILL